MKSSCDPALNSPGSSIPIPVDGVSVEGELLVPYDATGVVLFAHGSGSSRHSPRNRYVAQMLREAGVGTLLFDLLTPEEEQEDRHTQEFRFDIGLLANRLIAATRWISSLPECGQLNIGYFGASTGAAAALVAAAVIGEEVKAVVSRGGRPDLAGEALVKVTAPTLLLVGGLDDVVLDLNEKARARMHCLCELHVVPGATHLFEETGTLEQVAHQAASWFSQHLGSTKTGGRP